MAPSLPVVATIMNENETNQQQPRVSRHDAHATKTRSEDELKVSKELLANLPSARAHVIYEALAKLKAGHYSSEKIISEAAAKLIESGELNDIRSP